MSIPTRSIRLSNPRQVSLGRRLGLGEQHLVHRDRSRSYAVWVFSVDEVATIEREYAALRRRETFARAVRKVEEEAESFRPPADVDRKVREYAESLLADPFCTYSEHEAWARAREAYGVPTPRAEGARR